MRLTLTQYDIPSMALDFSVRRSLLYLRDTKSDEASAHLSAQLQLMRAYHGANPQTKAF